MTIRAVVPMSVGPRWAHQLGMSAEQIWERLGEVWADGALGGITESDVYRRIAELLEIPAVESVEFMDELWEKYLGTANVELTEYFRSLRPAYRTALLSNSFVGAREREQARYGFQDLCDLIVYSHEVGVAKPERRVYEITCERLGVLPDESIFLDDAPVAVEAARAFGMHAVLFKDNARAIREIEACLRANR